MGDFNINLLNFESHPITEQFLNSLGTFFSFHPHILKPTRITNHSATLIDNIFSNSAEHLTASGNILYDISDHLPNFLIMNKFCTLPSNLKFFKRDYTNFDQRQSVSDISAIDWTTILSRCSDVDDMFDSFYSNLNKIVDKHVPLKQLSKKEIKISCKPWITKGLRTSIRKKKKLYVKFMKTKLRYYETKYKIYRNKLSKLVKVSKKKYYDFFLENSNNIKNIWKGIKQIITLKPQKTNLPTKLVTGDSILTDSKSIANAFNDFFSNIGNNLARSIPEVSSISPLDYLPVPPTSSFFLFPVTSSEIEEEILNLHSRKATGPFSIPTELLKLLKHVVSKPLEILFNYSFSQGKVPSSFKIARVIPIHKKGSLTSVDNYRPISLLSIFNRLLEKLMYNRLIAYLDKLLIRSRKQ